MKILQILVNRHPFCRQNLTARETSLKHPALSPTPRQPLSPELPGLCIFIWRHGLQSGPTTRSKLPGSTNRASFPFSSVPRLPVELWSDDTVSNSFRKPIVIIHAGISIELLNVATDFLFVQVQMSSPNSIRGPLRCLGAKRADCGLPAWMHAWVHTHAHVSCARHAAVLAPALPGGEVTVSPHQRGTWQI